jgi:hypothetical protein
VAVPRRIAVRAARSLRAGITDLFHVLTKREKRAGVPHAFTYGRALTA